MATRSRGFTLVELVVVLVLIGILAAIAGPRFFEVNAYREGGLRGEIASAVRYAQKLAIASRCPVRVTIASGGFVYALRMQDADGNPPADCTGAYIYQVPRPENPSQFMERTDAEGVSVSSTVSQFTFDGLGVPDAAGGVVITVGGRAIRVEAGTGLVHVQ